MKKTLLFVIVALLLVPVVLYIAAPDLVVDFAIDLERRSAGLTRNSILVGDHTVVYLEGGKGENVLLIHGFGADKDNWNRLAKYLTPEFHVVAVDLPGFGESTKRQEASYAIADQVERVDAIADALSLKTFHLAGNSMGGNIAAKYAVRFPEKVLTLGLFDTGGIHPCPNESEIEGLLERGENPLLVESPEDFDAMMRFVFVKPPWFPGIVKKKVADEWAKSRPFNEKVFREIHVEGSSLEPDLPEIRTRTLILWGDKDRLIDVSCADMLGKGLPNSTTVIMKDCGHVPMMERPEETARHYLDFLKTT